jgi:hypothetical protein
VEPVDIRPAEAAAPPARQRARSAAAAITALILYALLVDAAIETYQAGSPVTTWVAAPVALYVSFSVWLVGQHRTHRPPAMAAVWLSLFLFLAMLAVTATLPGGFENGMRAVTLSTSALMSVAMIALIAVALLTLVFDSPLPLAARLVVAAVGCYGLAAFGTGLAWHRSFPQLFHGRSFWEPLPYWSQGAFLGSMVVVPLGLVIEVGVALARVKVRGRLYRIVAFALAFIIAYSAFAT